MNLWVTFNHDVVVSDTAYICWKFHNVTLQGSWIRDSKLGNVAHTWFARAHMQGIFCKLFQLCFSCHKTGSKRLPPTMSPRRSKRTDAVMNIGTGKYCAHTIFQSSHTKHFLLVVSALFSLPRNRKQTIAAYNYEPKDKQKNRHSK